MKNSSAYCVACQGEWFALVTGDVSKKEDLTIKHAQEGDGFELSHSLI